VAAARPGQLTVVQHTGVAPGDATVLWAQVATLLALAWMLGALARRVGQPPIVGSLIAGVLAGPSVFGQVWPGGFHWFRPGTQMHAGLLGALASFCLLILLIALGAETDLSLIRRSGRRAGAVTASSLLLPLAVGVAVAAALPGSFLGVREHRVSFVLLVAAAMSVSSLPVIARIVAEMGITRREVGQLAFAAATVNDAVGFIVLTIATVLVGGGGNTKLVIAIGGLVVLTVATATAGQRTIDVVLRRSRRDGPDVAAAIGAMVVFTLVIAAIAQGIGVDAALGAFLAGIIIGRSPYVPLRAMEAVRWSSDAVFAPLYFATAGLSVDVTLLGNGSAFGWFAVVLVAAVASKLLGVLTGARVGGVAGRDAVALGVLLNGRGALQVILAAAGLTTGILSPTAFTVIILISVISSVSVPVGLRRVLQSWQGTADEQRRLASEEELASNVMVRGQRLLLPTRGSANSIAAARILDLAWPAESEVTLLRVAPDRQDPRGIELVRQMLGQRNVRDDSAGEAETVAAVLAEANLGYGVIAIGAADDPAADRLLPWHVEELLNQSPVPLLIVRQGSATSHSEGAPVIRPSEILVPITGSVASRAGQEVAQMISRNTGADLHLMHVVTRRGAATGGRADPDGPASALVTEAREQMDEESLVTTLTTAGETTSQQICHEAAERKADLVVLGTTVRRVAGRPFLGHTVDDLLEHLTEPTLVVAVLPDAQRATVEDHVDRRTG
jgi:Kef-type K+ transport system membrane component KefB